MLQEDLDRLAQAPLDRSLVGLESAIWRGVEARKAERRTYASTFAVQVAILAIGTLSSLAVGRQWAASHESHVAASALAPYTRLAASTLLVGDAR